jgi:hypothetical protein
MPTSLSLTAPSLGVALYGPMKCRVQLHHVLVARRCILFAGHRGRVDHVCAGVLNPRGLCGSPTSSYTSSLAAPATRSLFRLRLRGRLTICCAAGRRARAVAELTNATLQIPVARGRGLRRREDDVRCLGRLAGSDSGWRRLAGRTERFDVEIERRQVALVDRTDIEPRHGWQRPQRLHVGDKAVLSEIACGEPEVGCIGRSPWAAKAERSTAQRPATMVPSDCAYPCVWQS